MKRLNKIELISLTYLLMCAISYAFGKSNSFFDSFYFIREHGGYIAFLLLLKSQCNSSFAVLLIYGIIVYKAELIAYNLVLMFLPYSRYCEVNTYYDVVMILTGSIFLIIFTCNYFDQICKFINKLLTCIKQQAD